MIRADKKDTVKVQYVGTLADGTVFDRSPAERPLQFILGMGEVIEGFDEAVVGMYQGETRTVSVPAAKAYGPHRPDMVEEVDRSLLPENLDLRAGRQLEVTLENGEKTLLMVTGMEGDSVTLDANHPLAGKELTFEIELLEVEKMLDTPPDRPRGQQG